MVGRRSPPPDAQGQQAEVRHPAGSLRRLRNKSDKTIGEELHPLGRPAALLLMALALLACQSVAQDLVTLRGVNGAVEVIGEGDDQITVLYTWGTPYEMGYAHGNS